MKIKQFRYHESLSKFEPANVKRELITEVNSEDLGMPAQSRQSFRRSYTAQ